MHASPDVVENIAALAEQHRQSSPLTLMKLALERFENIAISFSGAEDVVLIDLACRVKNNVRVFSLDTGRLHPETYQFMETVREKFPIRHEILFPDAAAVEKLVHEKGLNSFYRDGHQECCGIRKVAPLQRKLATLDAWITGQRRDQSPDTRSQIAAIELDGTFGSPQQPLVKFNPLAGWSSAQVWGYIRERNLPFNPLHDRGYVSIGCAPCTRAIQPGEHERAGRWWWEEATKKECGLHLPPAHKEH